MMTQDQFLNRILPLQPTLQLVAERLLGSSDEAEDAVQEVVLRMWEHRRKLERMVNIEGYAMNSLKNQCLTVLRRRHRTIPVEMLENVSDDDIRREAAITEERAAMLDSMMQLLPEVQRRAVQMRYIDCLSHEEMQRRLGMSSTNVYATISRAVSALKNMCHGKK
ncbi:MAG: sigma-70 family RNA polymerase sigma factor [Bacteroidales bacterium]|nr:sigma-70 family RNA polymerase sigma factor [Bacteroidales bacterium]